MADPFDISGKVVFITGAAGLLGKAASVELARRGALVVMCDNDKAKLDAAAKDAGSAGGEVLAFPLDITSPESVKSAVDAALKRFGRIDVLLNSAYPRNANYGRLLESIELKDWNENVDMHLGGYFNVTQAVARHMVAQRSGSIILMGSVYGVVSPDFSVYENANMRITSTPEYVAIKGALINLARYLATYLGKHNVRVNALSPGGVFTGPPAQPEAFVREYVKRVPLGRMASADDVVNAVIFLASDASSYITGHNLLVDGGWTAK